MSTLRPSTNPAKANPHAISIRIKSRDKRGTANQRAHDLRIGRQPKYVDEDRSSLNRHLIQALTASEIGKICQERRDASGIERERAVASNTAVATIGIITFGTEAQKVMGELDSVTQDALFMDVAEQVAKRLSTSVTGLSVHLDESAIHAHFQMPATSNSGTPVSKIAVKRVLNELQTIAAEVASSYDARIERGRSRTEREAAGALRSETINRQVKTLHEDLPLAIAALEKEIEKEKARLEKNQRLADKAQRKAQEHEARAEQALKNALRYEARASDAEATLKELTEKHGRLEKLQAEIAAAEERLAPFTEAMRALDRHAADIAAKIDADLQQEAETTAASILFSQEYDLSTIAILASGDCVDSGDGLERQMGGWQCKPAFEDIGFSIPAGGMTDFRGMMTTLKEADSEMIERQMEVFHADPDGRKEYDDVSDGLMSIRLALQSAGRWSRRLLNEVGGAARKMIEISFDRLADAIKLERVDKIQKQPPPKEATPFSDLPENTQAAIRRVSPKKEQDGP